VAVGHRLRRLAQLAMFSIAGTAFARRSRSKDKFGPSLKSGPPLAGSSTR